MTAPFPLYRTVAPLRERGFDVLVIGGGIYGAWAAYDAAARGLSVALIERDDWASGTSSASSKLIHGGLRYLEHYDFGLVRDALVERRRLHRMAPHLVRPLGFVMPVWKGPRASMPLLWAGLTLYDLLGGFKQPVPRHRRYSRAALLREFPYVDPERLQGGFLYGDCQEDDARMTLVVVAAAQGAGALVANRVEATELLVEGGAVTGARVRDRHADEAFTIRAHVTLNCAGPWAPQLAGDASPAVKRVKGTHLVLPAIPGQQHAFLLTARDGRVFFVIPWYGRTLVGTTEELVAGPEAARATEADVDYLLAGVKNGLPGIEWTAADVISKFAGVRTLQAATTANLAAVTREFTIAAPRPNLLMPLGGKYTTSRGDAAELVSQAERLLGREPGMRQTARVPLPGAPDTGEGFDRWQAAMLPLLRNLGVDAECARSLTLRHGTRIGRIAELIREQSRLARRLHPATTLVAAEAVLAVRDEMALSIDDVVRRRTPLALIERLGPSEIMDLAQLLAGELNRDTHDLIAEYRRVQAATA